MANPLLGALEGVGPGNLNFLRPFLRFWLQSVKKYIYDLKKKNISKTSLMNMSESVIVHIPVTFLYIYLLTAVA